MGSRGTVNNYIRHEVVDSLAKEIVGCRTNPDPATCRGQVQARFQALNDSKTGAGLYGCKGDGETACSGQLTSAKDGSARLDWFLDSFALSADEKEVLSHFQDSNHNDERIADHGWLQSFWSESGVSGGVLFGGALGLTTSGTKVTVGGKPIDFDGAFYSVDGLKFSKAYYERLWSEGRPAPFIQTKEVLNSSPKIIPDPRGAPGYFKYEGGGLEMICNPSTGQVGHIQPIRTK